MIFDFVTQLVERLHPIPISTENISYPSNYRTSTYEKINRANGG